MCGLAGFLSPNRSDIEAAGDVLSAMTGAIRHRGPDDVGTWIDAETGFALGHRRLAVLDLSAAGHQPMLSPSGRFVIAYNGEIYNHLDLRRMLRRNHWQGSSDTETLVAAIEELGLERTLRAAVGMFAVALWDREGRTLSLARDRLGEKPLYYGWQGRTFLFGSELKALRRHPEFRGEIDRAALADYVRNGYVPGPKSIFAGIGKLPPGCVATIRADGQSSDVAAPSPYWRLENVIADSVGWRFKGSDEDAVAELEQLLLDAIKGQQLADVPLGAFLSGGVDSSVVAALMCATSTAPVKTFSIGFEEQAYDEAPHARAVAQHLETDHTELYVSARSAMDVIPELPAVYDEPFADPSQIPTVLVARLARRHVTVALSGDGGDELFCGYSRYENATATWRRLSAVPLPLRTAIRPLTRGALRAGIATRDVDSFYQFTNTQWKSHPRLVVGSGMLPSRREYPPAPLDDPRERMMYTDIGSYLPDDILVKVDRAAMAVSLETRVPLLDHRVVEFAWRLPIELKTRGGVGKWPLKQILYKRVPRELVERPKMGFGVPLESWLRGPLREWADDLLTEKRIAAEGFFDAKAIRREWALHLSGRKDRHYGLWTMLMFQSWLASQRSRAD
jgi:asparagine synthase (glutamine-hydrolysing)